VLREAKFDLHKLVKTVEDAARSLFNLVTKIVKLVQVEVLHLSLLAPKDFTLAPEVSGGVAVLESLMLLRQFYLVLASILLLVLSLLHVVACADRAGRLLPLNAQIMLPHAPNSLSLGEQGWPLRILVKV